MGQYYIETTITYYYQGEFDSKEDAEQFGYNFDEMNYDGIDEISVQELEEEEEEDE